MAEIELPAADDEPPRKFRGRCLATKERRCCLEMALPLSLSLSRLFLSFVHQNGLKLGSFLFVDISDDCININAMIEK